MHNPIGPMRAAYSKDPAIDREATDLERYGLERDPALLVFRDGMQPRWFHLRDLTGVDGVAIDSGTTWAIKLKTAFTLAVSAVDNGNESVRPTGDAFVHRDTQRIPIWSTAEFNALAQDVGLHAVYEIGRIAFDRVMAGKAWSGADSYTPPQ